MGGEFGARAIAAALPKSALAALSLAHNQVGDEAAQAIIRALPPSAVSLDLAGNTLTDSSAAMVAEAFYRIPGLAVSLSQNKLSSGLRILLHEEHGSRLRL